MTLMEMMVVTLIAALVMTGMAFGLSSLTRQRLKSSTLQVAAAVRTAYSRSATTGNTVRLIFDFENRTIWAEEAESGRVLLSRNDEENLEEEGEEEGADGLATNAAGAGAQAQALSGLLGADPSSLLSAAQGAAQADMGDDMNFELLGQISSMGQQATEQMGETPRYRAPSFSTVPGRLGERSTLGEGVSYALIYTAHREDPAEDGRAALYFFPGGLTELAVIQLRDDEGFINSVEVHPLTGRCTIHDVPYEPPRDQEDQNEAREVF